MKNFKLVLLLIVTLAFVGCEKAPLKTNDFLEKGVWYEVFVRSFADSNGDGVGDLKGLTAKLDYLNDNKPETNVDLGVNGLWLMPLQPSPSYHGYDVTDYYGINPDYGTMEDFETLIEEAHKRDIKIIMDFVMNHSSAEHPWFVDAIQDEKSPYRDFYRIVSEQEEGYNFKKQVWNHPVWNKVGNAYYYAIFWDQMPDLNYDSQDLKEEMINVAAFWLDKGVDGFRIDAVSHIFGSGELKKGENYNQKTKEWWSYFDGELRKIKPDYYLVGEAWEGNKARLSYADVFDSTFNFDLGDGGILTMVKNEVDLDGNNNGLIQSFNEAETLLNEYDGSFIDLPFLSNHDQRRSMDYLGSQLEDMKLAANIYMTLPGNPFIYYGEELGMLGNKPDETIREPFIWGSEDSYQTNWEALEYNATTLGVDQQEKDSESLLEHYKLLIRLRQSNEALFEGAFVGLETNSPRVVAYKRTENEQELIVIHNLSSKMQSITLDELKTSSLIESLEIVFAYPNVSGLKNEPIELSPKSSLILKVKS